MTRMLIELRIGSRNGTALMWNDRATHQNRPHHTKRIFAKGANKEFARSLVDEGRDRSGDIAIFEVVEAT